MKQIDLRNTKIYLSSEDDRITFQKAAFKLGVRWLSGSNQVKHTKSPFIFIDKNMTMSCSNTPEKFRLSTYDQITSTATLDLMDKSSFRGIICGSEENIWAYGSLIFDKYGFSIHNRMFADSGDNSFDMCSRYVEESTVGQFTGVYDKVGNRIYEGDIVKDTADGTLRTVFYDSGGFVVEDNPKSFGYGIQGGTNPTIPLSDWQFNSYVSSHYKVIGNIHENADFLQK